MRGCANFCKFLYAEKWDWSLTWCEKKYITCPKMSKRLLGGPTSRFEASTFTWSPVEPLNRSWVTSVGTTSIFMGVNDLSSGVFLTTCLEAIRSFRVINKCIKLARWSQTWVVLWNFRRMQYLGDWDLSIGEGKRSDNNHVVFRSSECCK